MTEENQALPLAPARIYPRSDEESATIKPKVIRQERSNKFPVYFLAAVVILSMILLVFALIVLQPKNPDVKLRSVTVKNLTHGNATSPNYLNVTLITEVTIKNMNFGPFKFVDTTGIVLYDGMIVGDTKIGHGGAKAKETKKLNVTVDVRSYRLSDTKNLSVDINSGMVNLTSYAKLNGRVNLLNIIKKKRTAELNCSMSLNLTSQSIQDLICNT